MFKRIWRAIRRAKAASYVSTLKKQLKRLEGQADVTRGQEQVDLLSRVRRKTVAIERAVTHLGTLCFLLLVGCAHGPRPVDAIETAVVISEAVLEVCKVKHRSDAWDGSQPARDARERCLQVEDIDRARDATTALDDAIEAMEHWIKTGS